MAEEFISPRISLITLCRDNPAELMKTLRSVQHQTLSPATYVVVDSSSNVFRGRMQRMANAVSAQYIWIEPHGIYPAMVRSLDLVPQESYVWWINSSDWLAGPRSIELVVERLRKNGGGQIPWLIGGLVRLRDGKVPITDAGYSGDQFVSRLKAGQIGFPHPASVFWLPDLRKVRPFEDHLEIAADYSTALRFAFENGPPEILPATLSVHASTGFSARHPVRNFLEKSQARWMASSGIDRYREPFRATVNAWNGVLNLLKKEKGGLPLLADQASLLGETGHFCAVAENSTWPECCDRVLELPWSD